MKKSLVLFFIFLAKTLFCQTPFFKPFNIKFNYSGSTVKVVYKDNDGFMWLGASQHAIKTDGVNFWPYTPNNKQTGDVSAIFSDSKKNIWIGYSSGAIAVLKSDSLIECPFKEGCPQKSITSIAEDASGIIWFATKGEGVYYIYNNRLYNFDSEKDDITDNYVYVVTADKNNNVWLGTDQGITVCAVQNGNKKIIQKISSANGLPDDIVCEIIAGQNNNMILAFEDKGVCTYNTITQKVLVSEKYREWNYGRVNKVIATQNRLWIATSAKGLVVDDEPNTLGQITSFNNSKFEKINSLAADNEGNIWISSETGVYISTGKKLQVINEVNNAALTNVHVVLSSANNKLWFTPHQGLMMRDSTKKGTLFKVTDDDNATDIISLYQDKCGYIWTGTAGKGLYRVNPVTGKSTKIFNDHEFNATSILSLAGDGEYLWISTLGGVKKIKIENCNADNVKTKPINFDPKNVIGSYYVYSVFVDSKKRVWFGTDGKGLIKLESNTFTFYDSKDGLKSDVIYSVTEDLTGKIWINTLNEGLYSFDEKTFKNFSVENGLTDANIASIVCDNNNQLLVLHANGIDIIAAARNHVTYYGKEFGLADINPQPNAVFKTIEGTIYIGCEKGILVYESNLHKQNNFPQAHITSVHVFPYRHNFIGTNTFEYDYNNLSVSFTSLWFSDAERVQFRYKLEGYSNEWNITRDRKLNFPNLPPGHYVFKLTASLNNNFLPDNETSCAFTIKKPFWKEYWFIALASLAIAILFFLYTKSREKSLKRLAELKKEKIRFQFETLRNQVNPHFLFNSFNTLISIIEEDKDVAVEYVEKLSEFFRNIVTYKDKDVITLAEEIKTASTYFYLQQKRYGKNLSLEMNIDLDANEKKIPPMVLQILIENSVKHNAVSKETPLAIKIVSQNKSLIVSNNINPKRQSETSTGTGLQNISNRYKLLTNDEIKIQKDTQTFSVTLPLID